MKIRFHTKFRNSIRFLIIVKNREKILIVDDLIATGGTACAAAKLIQDAGGQVVGASFVIELPDIGGRKKLEDMGIKVNSLVEFEGD